MPVKRRGQVATAITDSSGNVLNGDEIVENIENTTVLWGSGNPNGTVTGAGGQTYIDTLDKKIYRCTEQLGGNSWDVVG